MGWDVSVFPKIVENLLSLLWVKNKKSLYLMSSLTKMHLVKIKKMMNSISMDLLYKNQSLKWNLTLLEKKSYLLVLIKSISFPLIQLKVLLLKLVSGLRTFKRSLYFVLDLLKIKLLLDLIEEKSCCGKRTDALSLNLFLMGLLFWQCASHLLPEMEKNKKELIKYL